MADLTEPPSPSIPYASPTAPAPARFGPVLVLITGVLLVGLSILPWFLVFTAVTDRNGSSGSRDAVVGIFGGIGAVVLLLGAFLIVAATRRLLR